MWSEQKWQKWQGRCREGVRTAAPLCWGRKALAKDSDRGLSGSCLDKLIHWLFYGPINCSRMCVI